MATETPLLWDPQIYDTFLSQKNNIKSGITSALGQMETQLISMANSDSSIANLASNQYDSKKPLIEQKLIELQTLNQELESKQSAMDISQLKFQIAAKKDEIDDVRNARDTKQTLVGLRKEQATALANKYDSNYHSSWLGLWRPMSTQSQYGLSFFAGLFGFIAVALLGWMGWTWFIESRGGKAGVGGGLAATNVGGNFGLGEL